MNKRVLTYGVVTPDILKSYDGLEFLKAMIAGYSKVSLNFTTTIRSARSMAASPRRCSILRSAAQSFRPCTRAIPGLRWS